MKHTFSAGYHAPYTEKNLRYMFKLNGKYSYFDTIMNSIKYTLRYINITR